MEEKEEHPESEVQMWKCHVCGPNASSCVWYVLVLFDPPLNGAKNKTVV